MELNPAARSEDGKFIVRQGLLEDIPYGVRPSSRNGCGWIAAYNFLIADGHPAKWDQVRRDLQHLLPFKGKLGANVWVLRGYLRHKGCHLHSALTPAGIKAQAEGCRAGILMYWNGSHSHYVAIQRQRDGSLRFLNAGVGLDDEILSVEEFYQRCVKFPVVFGFFTR